jgi:hypothetical protein
MKNSLYILRTTAFTLLAACGGGDSSTLSAVREETSASWVGTKQLGVANQITYGNALAIDRSGNVYVTGSTKGGLDGNQKTGSTFDAFVTKYSSNGVKQFTRQFGVAGQETVGTAVVTDDFGNVYVVGYTTGGLDNNDMAGSTRDMFVAKYNSNGIRQFTRQLGVAREKKVGIGVAVDASGNFFVAGYTTGAVNGQDMTGTVDAFYSKYNRDGILQFTRLLGAAGRETRGYAVSTDLNGNVFVAGYTEGSLDGNTLNGSADFFVTKYNSSGVKQFTRQLGAGNAETVGTAVATDITGNVYVTGRTTGGLDGNTLTGTHDFFVTKYNRNGVKQFTRQLGAAGAETRGNEVATDASGNVFVTGATGGALDGNILAGTDDFFVTKYNSDGLKQFTRQLGVAGRETDGNGVAIDASGNVFVAGATGGALDGNTPMGSFDFFVTKFSNNGVRQ